MILSPNGNFSGNTSLPKAVVNILKVYQVIDRHLKRYPHDAPRFPGFNLPRRTVLAAGAAGPLEGELDLAEYFVGIGRVLERL
jgi:hypothetical protein